MNRRPPLKAHILVVVALTLATVILGGISPYSAQAETSTGIDNGQDTLFFIGDSLTVGTEAFGKLQQRLDRLAIWDRVVINAKVGRRTDQSLRILRSSMPTSTTALVIALGTNDVISKREPSYPSWVIDQVMEASDGRPVLWFNTDFSPTGRGDWRFRSRRFNRALRDAREEWPNLLIADWFTYFTPTGKNRFQSDGVHLSVSAYKLRASFTESQVRRFGESVINASTTTTSTTTTSTPTTSTTTSPTTTSLPTSSTTSSTSSTTSTSTSSTTSTP